MSFFSKLFGKSQPSPDDGDGDGGNDADAPFMEYPSDDYASSLAAMTDAFARLQQGGHADRWITFSGQGKGHDEDSDAFEDVLVRGDTFDLRDQTPDLPALLRFAKLEGHVEPQRDADGLITLAGASPDQLARFLDAIFRHHYGIHPHDDEDDYAVGAEW